MSDLVSAVKFGAGFSFGVLFGLSHPGLVGLGAYLLWVRHLYNVGDKLTREEQIMRSAYAR